MIDYLIDKQVEFWQYISMKGIKGLPSFVYEIQRGDVQWNSPFYILM